MVSIQEHINKLQEYIEDPVQGLPEEIFEFVSSITPMVNVDLLIFDKEKGVLLSWRDDEYCGRGWHIPGGIVRYKESMSHRIQEVAKKELGVTVRFDPLPIDTNEITMPQSIRGHFISFLYQCYLPEDYTIDKQVTLEKMPGYLKWHKHLPINLVRGQKQVYSKYFNMSSLKL